MSTLKEQLRADLTAAMKARDELVKSTLRMTLTAVGNAEVAGTEARELSDDEVLKVIAKEAKKRAESAEAFNIIVVGYTEGAQTSAYAYPGGMNLKKIYTP